MTTALRVLLVEDSEADALLVLRALRSGGFDPSHARVETAEAMRAALREQWDIVLCDYSLPEFDGLQALCLLREQAGDVPFIMVSGKLGEDTAVEVMKAGAGDFVTKDRLTRLCPAVRRALEEAALRRQNREAEEKLRESERRLATLMSNLPGMAYRCRNDPERTMEFVSEGCMRLTGYLPDELVRSRSTSYGRLIHPDDAEGVQEGIRNAIAARGGFGLEYRLRTAGVERWAWDQGRGVHGPGGELLALEGFIADITAAKEAEARILGLNRTLRLISECNGVLVRTGSEAELMADVCRIIAEHGGYPLAWVRLFGPDETDVLRPAAGTGEARAYLDALPEGRDAGGTMEAALRTGRYAIARDVPGDTVPTPWKARAREFGFASEIVLPLASGGRTLGILGIFSGKADAFDPEECEVLVELADDLAYGIVALRTRTERDLAVAAREQGLQQLRRSLEDTIQAIATAAEMRDPYTAGHQRRVADLAAAIAREMGLTEDQAWGIRLAGVVHDIGKIHVPAEILAKPGHLNAVEYSLIRTHVVAGYEILKNIQFPWPIAEMVLQHHELFDGSGYPRGLSGEQMLPEARILAVADAVEAIASHRPYRPAHGLDEALMQLAAGRGRVYDPEAADACLALFREKGYAFPD